MGEAQAEERVKPDGSTRSVCVHVVCVKCAHDDLPSCPLPNTLHSSAAGQFFPEAAQVAYQMWELSAVARVEVRPSPPPA